MPRAITDTARGQHGVIDHRRPTSCAMMRAGTWWDVATRAASSRTCNEIRRTRATGRENTRRRESITLPRYLTRVVGPSLHFATLIVSPQAVASKTSSMAVKRASRAWGEVE